MLNIRCGNDLHRYDGFRINALDVGAGHHDFFKRRRRHSRRGCGHRGIGGERLRADSNYEQRCHEGTMQH